MMHRLLPVIGLALLSALPLGAEHRVETAKIPTEGGLVLATDIYRPTKVPAPTILIRTPYGRNGLAFLGEAFAGEGYVVAIQDVRGKYDSTGDHEPFLHERADGLASLRWLEKRPWCNGRIGMWGLSYSGYAALVLADSDVESLQSIFSISGWLAAEEITKPGGAMHLLLDLPWMLSQQGRRQRNLGEFDIDAVFRHTPLRDALRSVGIRNPQWENPDWLAKIAPEAEIEKVERPIFHMTGWHDMVYAATLDAWERVSARARAPQKLAIGPWYHNQMLFESWEVGDADFGKASGFGTAEMITLSLRWFDATLRGRKNGILSEPPVRFFLMGQNAWHAEKRWPPPPRVVERQRWYLDSGGAANGREGDGSLARNLPRGTEPDRFVFDPHDPVPTLGGANFFYFPELLGVRDQREIERRDDVLVYTSSPLPSELQVVGAVSVTLTAASSAPATDFTAKLVVVRPDGYARIVEEGIARIRNPATAEPFEVQIDVGQTAISVPQGHRLRLEVSSSNFPKYDRNPNTGEDPFLATEFRTATQTIFHTEELPSYLTLPVRREPLVASASARRPLVRPREAGAVMTVAVEGDDAEGLIAQGRSQLEAEQVDSAIATLQRATELAPEDARGHFWLGRAYLAKLQSASMFKKLGLSKKVRSSYIRAITLDPDDLEARSSLAQYYTNAPAIAGGSFEKALEQIAEIKKRDAPLAHLLLAGIYAEREETDEAKREYRSAIELRPEDPDSHYALGLLCQRAKQWAEAAAAFEAGAALGDLRSLYQIGRTGVFSGERLERAQEALTSYIERAPGSANLPSVAHAHWRLGMIHERQQRRVLARREYETALRLDPELEQAREALESLE